MIAHVGEVERRPVRQFDEVGDRWPCADAVDQVADRAAGQQPRRHPHPRPDGVAREDVADDGERERRLTTIRRRPAAVGEAEGDAAVVREGEADRAEDVDLLAGDEVVLDHRLGDLVEDDDDDRQSPPPGPGARRDPGCSRRRSADGTIPSAMPRTQQQAEHWAEVEGKAAATERRQEATEEVEVRVGGVGDEVEHARSAAGRVGHARHPVDQDVEEDQDDVDEEEGADR